LIGLFAAGWSSIWWGVILTVAWSAIRGLFTARGFLRKLGSMMAMFFFIPFMIAGIAAPPPSCSVAMARPRSTC
jgi:hypothetical protein